MDDENGCRLQAGPQPGLPQRRGSGDPRLKGQQPGSHGDQGSPRMAVAVLNMSDPPFRKPRPGMPGKNESVHDSSRTPKTQAPSLVNPGSSTHPTSGDD
jgi:hypothetical protein